MGLPWANKKQNELPQRRHQVAGRLTRQSPVERRGQYLFRRNRTLVGSMSTEVRSSGELTGNLQSPRVHVHHLSAHRRLLTRALLTIVATSCFLIWLLYNFTAKIDVSATDSIVIDEPRYQKAVNDYLNGHLTERLRFALNNDNLSLYLESVVPEVAHVEMNGASGLAATHFDLLFRRPVASWEIAGTKYYVDQEGVLFRINYFDSPTVKIVDNSGVPQPAGTTIASSRFLRFVGRTVTLASASGLTITEAIIPSGTTHQIEVIIKGHGYPVKLSLDRPVGEQIEDMRNAVRYFTKHRLTPKYIDVRVSGKAFYR